MVGVTPTTNRIITRKEGQPVSQPAQVARVSVKTSWSVLLAIIGITLTGIGVGVKYGGAESAIVVGALIFIHSVVLALPEHHKHNWG